MKATRRAEDALAGPGTIREPRLPLKRAAPAILLAFAIVPHAGAEIDATKRSDAFEPAPVEQERVEKKRTEVGPSQPAGDRQVELITVPAATAKTRMPPLREKEKAPVDMTARSFPSHRPEPAQISTARAAPAGFDRKTSPQTVARYQDGMTEAGRVKTSKVKASAKPSVIERINRFVFRRNATEPATAIEPAGGNIEPVEGAPRSESAGS